MRFFLITWRRPPHDPAMRRMTLVLATLIGLGGCGSGDGSTETGSSGHGGTTTGSAGTGGATARGGAGGPAGAGSGGSMSNGGGGAGGIRGRRERWRHGWIRGRRRRRHNVQRRKRRHGRRGRHRRFDSNRRSRRLGRRCWRGNRRRDGGRGTRRLGRNRGCRRDDVRRRQRRRGRRQRQRQRVSARSGRFRHARRRYDGRWHDGADDGPHTGRAAHLRDGDGAARLSRAGHADLQPVRGDPRRLRQDHHRRRRTAEIVVGGFFLAEGVHNVIIRNLTIRDAHRGQTTPATTRPRLRRHPDGRRPPRLDRSQRTSATWPTA